MHWSVILSVFGFVGSISTFILAIIIDGKMITEHIFPASTLEWAALLGVGFSSFVVQISFTQALKYEMAATVSLERKAADVIFAFLYQVTIFMVRFNLQYIRLEKHNKMLVYSSDSFDLSYNSRKYLLLTVLEEPF